MKIKTISRSEEQTVRGSNTEVVKIYKNTDPKLHPFEKARELTRAVRAAKMDKMFSKPFIAAMDDHSDGIYCSATNPTSLVSYVSGAADGQVIVWDLATNNQLWSVYAHNGFVRGLTVSNDGSYFFSCGDDRTIKQWRMAAHDALAMDDSMAERLSRYSGNSLADGSGRSVTPANVWTSRRGYMYIDHHPTESKFAASSSCVEIYDVTRSTPLHTFEWGVDTVTTVRFNPAESNVLASTGADRSVILYDLRQQTPIKKKILTMNTNALAFNPREPFIFSTASEDHNAYSFDMRRLDSATMVHKDHVGPVMDISYSPTGKEFATGSYDRTVRVFRADGGRSREMYHTKRMQRVFTVKFTGDAKYILSGSDDANVRVWKARANENLVRQLPGERRQQDYARSLVARYAHLPEVRSVVHSKTLPKYIVKARDLKHGSEQKQKRKDANTRAHAPKGSTVGVPVAERKRMIIK